MAKSLEQSQDFWLRTLLHKQEFVFVSCFSLGAPLMLKSNVIASKCCQ